MPPLDLVFDRLDDMLDIEEAVLDVDPKVSIGVVLRVVPNWLRRTKKIVLIERLWHCWSLSLF